MQRSFLRYTRVLLLPVLAMGLVLTGCDSAGSNGGNGDNGDNGDDGSTTFAYPSSDYGAETVVNLLAFDLGVRVGNAADNDEDTLLDLYTGDNNTATIKAAEGLTTEGQNVYSDIASGVDVSSRVSTDDLVRGDQLVAQDTPNDGQPVNTNELLREYFRKAGVEDSTRTSNGIVLSQFAEKMLLGTPIYGQGAAILSDFASGNTPSNPAEEWDRAFGYFGFPRALEPFLDYSDGTEGLADGAVSRDLDGDGVDLTSEYVHTWASYAIERSAAAANIDGTPSPDFARDAFNALVEGRKDIQNDEDPTEHAQTALDAWEATVAVNVIHYINSVKGSLPSSGSLENGDVDEGAWGEAKAFAWSLQFYSRDALSSQDLNSVLEDIGNDPPYDELTVSEYRANLNDALSTLETAYGFNEDNVDNW